MWTVGALSFVVPWALAGLAALPVIWWLLRLKPPMPRRIIFPPIVLLQRLTSQRESPARIPPWLLLLRLVLAGLIIIGMAGPLLNAETQLFGKGPVYVIVDDGWAASAAWPARKSAIRDLLDHAERQGRAAVLVATSPVPEGAAAAPPQLMSAGDARRLFDGLQPKPWATDRAAAVNALLANDSFADQRPGDVIWLSDGVGEDPNVGPSPESADKAKAAETVGMDTLVKQLRKLGAVTVFTDAPGRLPIVLMPPEADGAALAIEARRVRDSAGRGVQVRAVADDGEILGRLPLAFRAGAAIATGRLEMPAELRNRLARLEVIGAQSVAGVVLTDERWRRRPVGLLTAVSTEASQPLLDALHYLGQAVGPFAEVRRGSVEDLLKRNLAVMIMADPGRLNDAETAGVTTWIDKGGIVLRFAGPRLAREAGARDPLLPVQLRRGGRVIGGALSWRQPEALAAFPAISPFFGLPVPPDVKIRRQVLAQPSLDLADKTWARLSDGTPLVTAAKRGQGWLVLVHTTANAEWSDLAFSGLFVDMLQRLVRLSQGVASGAGSAPLPPISTLDAFGRLGDPPGGATAVPGKTFTETRVSPKHPPGYYGTQAARRALNLSQNMGALSALGDLPAGVERRTYARSEARDLKPWLLAAAALLFLVDLLASMWIRGLLGMPALRAGLIILAASLPLSQAGAQSQSQNPTVDAFAQKNSLETSLAYVYTGDRRIDEISAAGLTGLNLILWRRTAAELGPPQGINPAVDDLSFFPLLYWPVIPGYTLPQGAAARIVAYLRNGGTILFDTRDQASDTSSGVLAQLSQELEIPPLVPVSRSHVLTRSFYLLKEFPGRWTGGALWVEKAGERINDGVSPVIAGSHDWAAAWAVDAEEHPLFPVVPGGERQREMAYRFGVNLVMYTLTGNYKADQVHMPAIIQRLGQ